MQRKEKISKSNLARQRKGQTSVEWRPAPIPVTTEEVIDSKCLLEALDNAV